MYISKAAAWPFQVAVGLHWSIWLAVVAVTVVFAIWVPWLWWLVAAELAFVLTFKALPHLQPVRDLLTAMWMPVGVLVVAAYALFATDQGRDLGVGLLDATQLELALFAGALFYWATGTWHAARLGLNRIFGTDRDKWDVSYSKTWLHWLPRFLGATAHLYAMFVIGLAASYELNGMPSVLPFVPTMLILVGILFLWWNDKARDAYVVLKRAQPEQSDNLEAYKLVKDRMFQAVIALLGSGAIIIVLLVAAWLTGVVPTGFVAATSWVLFSATLFLLIVNYRAAIGEWVLGLLPDTRQTQLQDCFKESKDTLATSSKVLEILLVAVAVAVVVWAWFDPVGLGDALGSLVLGFFAFGVYVVIISGLLMMAGTFERRAVVGVFILLLAVGTQLGRNFHAIRLCGDPGTECESDHASPEMRATVQEAAVAWYKRARGDEPGTEPIPMLIVATAGGGIRAAYWTATVLEKLEEELTPEVLRRHLFAISGVSGGSVGAAAYMAAVAKNPGNPENPNAVKPTHFLEDDFLAPALAALAFVDVPSSFLPDFGQVDRATALEQAFEAASKGTLKQPFLSFFPSAENLKDTKQPWQPALLLNGAHQNTGRRVITSHLQVTQDVFLNAFDAHDLLGADMPASTAAHNGARFTYISPAGRLLPRDEGGEYGRSRGFLLDGGYFENYGAVTALQLLRGARAAINEYRRIKETEKTTLPEVRPIVLQISSDPSLHPRDRARTSGDDGVCAEELNFLPFEDSDAGGLAVLNEFIAPLAGIIASRDAHGTLATKELARAICVDRPNLSLPTNLDSGIDTPLAEIKGGSGVVSADVSTPSTQAIPSVYAHLAMCEGEGTSEPIKPPLGWVLSKRLQGKFESLLKPCGNDAELTRVLDALRPPGDRHIAAPLAPDGG